MNITGTHINYYHYCKKRLWLHINNINLEESSEYVLEGKLIEQSSFKRRSDKNKQILLGSIKIDFLDDKNKILYETKKSSKNIEVAIWQMKYYLYVLNNNDWKGIIEIPKEKKKIEVLLSDDDKTKLNLILKEIENIKKGTIPKIIKSPKCKKCSFHDFCFS